MKKIMAVALSLLMLMTALQIASFAADYVDGRPNHLKLNSGVTVFEENLFTNRYRHVDELIRMGADIRVFGRTAVVTGMKTLHGASVRCTDLRGGAALCVAALAAEGESRISEWSIDQLRHHQDYHH